MNAARWILCDPILPNTLYILHDLLHTVWSHHAWLIHPLTLVKELSGALPQIHKGDPRLCIPPHVMESSAMGSNWGSSGFCRPHTQKQTQNQWVHDLCTPCSVLRVFYLHAQTTVDAGDMRTWRTVVILITGKTRRPPIWATCRDKNGPGSALN